MSVLIWAHHKLMNCMHVDCFVICCKAQSSHLPYTLVMNHKSFPLKWFDVHSMHCLRLNYGISYCSLIREHTSLCTVLELLYWINSQPYNTIQSSVCSSIYHSSPLISLGLRGSVVVVPWNWLVTIYCQKHYPENQHKCLGLWLILGSQQSFYRFGQNVYESLTHWITSLLLNTVLHLLLVLATICYLCLNNFLHRLSPPQHSFHCFLVMV